MAYTDPVSSNDDPSLVIRKAAVAWGADISQSDDDDLVARKACAALQGIDYPND